MTCLLLVLLSLTLLSVTPLSGAEQAPATQVQIVRPLGLERALARYLLARWRKDVHRVAVRVLAPRRPIPLPAGRLSVHVRPLAKVLRPGRLLFDVRFLIDGAPARDVRVAAWITAYAMLALTTRRVERGQILTEEDLARGEWRIRAIEHGLAVSPDEAVGKRVQVPIPAALPIPRVTLVPLD